MARCVHHVIKCDGPGCAKEFGGPQAGDYGTVPADEHDALFSGLENEALDLGWLTATRYTDTGYFHSIRCLTAWLKIPLTN